jgi:AcrR family transcriptional regulator
LVATETRPSESQVAQHILRVSARLFAERGYDATPVRLIAEEAGVTKPTLYYHFRSKEGIAHALLGLPMRRLAGVLKEIADRPDDPAALLGDFIEAHFAFCREEPDHVRFIYALVFGPLGAGSRKEVQEGAGRCHEQLDIITAKLERAGRLRAEAFERFRTAVLGLITIHTIDYLYKNVNLHDGLGHQLVSDLLDGFGATAGPAGEAGEPRR